MIPQQAAEELPPEKLQEFKDIFSFFDRDGGGSIGAEEFDQVRLIYEKLNIIPKYVLYKQNYS